MEHIEIVQGVSLSASEIEELTFLWEGSVRATHLFLTEENISSLLPLVKIGISEVEKLLIAKKESSELLGFLGVAKDKIEMLFVSHEVFGKGIGKHLVHYAKDNLSIKLVDVNEQNEQAVGFYKHLGFEVYNRSELDGQGNPFPILNMKLASE